MKNKIVVLALVLTMGLMLVACGGASSDTKVIESGTSSADNSATGTDTSAASTYVFSYNGMTMEVDADAAPIVEKLGEPSSYFESPSCAGEGIGKLYTYADFEIQTYPEGDKDLILYVLLRTDNVATAEGIDLSKSKDDIVAAYGQPDAETDSALTYKKNGMSLVFLFDGDDMISIEYDSSKN